MLLQAFFLLCWTIMSAQAETAMDGHTILRRDIPVNAPRFEDFRMPVYSC